ncbi:MAG: type II toxin-antitoxin system RelE/ParE family toxin [Dongiaceae bacterium]
MTVVETPEFLSACRKLMDEGERGRLVDYLAANPTAGAIIRETGGVRKLRWGLEGRGKRGGARVIYYHYDAHIPLFALTAYAKNAHEDLSPADRKSFKALVKALIETYARRRT